MVYVVNKKTHVPTVRDFYIGRGSPVGNIYSHIPGTQAKHLVRSREEAVANFREYAKIEMSKRGSFYSYVQRIAEAARAGDVNLVCFCKPLNCHGDVLREIILNILCMD